MEDISGVTSLVETGGSLALICILVFVMVKGFLDYLTKRDAEENEMRKEILKQAQEDRESYNQIIHEEHTQHSQDMLNMVSKLGDRD